MNKLIKFITSAMISVMFVTGCSSIPLSTMMRLSSMGPEAFSTTNPNDIRVKFLMPEGFVLDVENASLILRRSGEDEVTQSVTMLLDLLQTETEERSAGLFRGKTVLTAYTFKLTDKSAEELFELQQTLVEGEKHSLQLAMSAPLTTIPPDASEMKLWIDIQLQRDKPYLRLFDGVTLSFETT